MVFLKFRHLAPYKGRNVSARTMLNAVLTPTIIIIFWYSVVAKWSSINSIIIVAAELITRYKEDCLTLFVVVNIFQSGSKGRTSGNSRDATIAIVCNNFASWVGAQSPKNTSPYAYIMLSGMHVIKPRIFIDDIRSFFISSILFLA